MTSVEIPYSIACALPSRAHAQVLSRFAAGLDLSIATTSRTSSDVRNCSASRANLRVRSSGSWTSMAS